MIMLMMMMMGAFNAASATVAAASVLFVAALRITNAGNSPSVYTVLCNYRQPFGKSHISIEKKMNHEMHT